ncbi:hypothetical protein GYMLUDRAFT_167508, partial [Collybiopsis luxurians FD-317 M1]
SLVLPPTVKQLKEYTIDGIVYSCYSSHPGNRGIQFYDHFNYVNCTGFIHKILQIPLQDRLQVFFFVEEHSSLSVKEEQKAPYLLYPQLKSKIVSAAASNIFYIIEPAHIITHLTTLTMPVGSFNFPYKTMII